MARPKKEKAQPFNFDEKLTDHGFMVKVPTKEDGIVSINEYFNTDKSKVSKDEMKIKATINSKTWAIIKPYIENEFNNRLEEKEISPGKFMNGKNYLETLLGKELTVLFWAIEDIFDEKAIEKAVNSWSVLFPEERWWLYKMINSETGKEGSGHYMRGWRMAIKYALADDLSNSKDVINGGKE